MTPISTEIRLKGVPLGPGIALGRACFYRQAASRPAIAAQKMAVNAVTYEEDRLHEALEGMIERLEVLARQAQAKLDSQTADVFRAHQLILEDPLLRQRLLQTIEGERLNAEGAVERQLERYQSELRALDSEYLQERAADIADLQRGLLNRLRQAAPYLRCKDMIGCKVGECRLGNDHILVAPELTPGLAIEVDSRTLGFLVEKGGPTSHAAILARALGLPAVSGIKDLEQIVSLDARILIDGEAGMVILNPSEETLERYHQIIRIGAKTLSVVDPIPELKVMANIDLATGVCEALAATAEGIGLYRTETEALAKGRLLTEIEQEARYTQVITAMGDRPVYIRLLDLGADKTAAWLGLPQEDNPALGCRGARLLLSRPELLCSQARAIARASRHRPIHVVYPMIINLDQFRKLRALFDSAIADLSPGLLWHGVMFEVPSACLQARQLLEEADFGCIGTNDLIQYLFAADRMNENVEYEELLANSLLWELIEGMAKAARQTCKPLSLCGELAGNPHFTRRIIDAGITVVSTSPGRIFQVRRAARGL